MDGRDIHQDKEHHHEHGDHLRVAPEGPLCRQLSNFQLCSHLENLCSPYGYISSTVDIVYNSMKHSIWP